MAAFVAAGFFGAFGGAGPLNHTAAHAPSFSIQYERFPAKLTPHQVRLTLHPGDAAASTTLSIENKYLERMHLEKVNPTPSEVVAREGEMLLHFAPGRGEQILVLTFRPIRAGKARSSFRLGGGAELIITQFVYP